MQPFLTDPFLDRVRRSYQLALTLGARTQGRLWKTIDARRRDVHAALIAEGNSALRDIFADPIATDLYFGTDNLCRSVIGPSNGRPFLELALESIRAGRAKYQLERLTASLATIGGQSVVEIGPGVGHCAFYAYRAGLTDYTTVDLPLGMVAQARFFAEALGPDKTWLDGDADIGAGDQIKLFSVARLPERRFDAALNVDSMTEMSLTAALDYMTWLNRHARLLLSMNHEMNPFTVASIAHYRLAGKRLERHPVPERNGYFEEVFLIDPHNQSRPHGLLWLRTKTLFWNIALPIRWRIPLLRPKIIPG